MKSITLQISEEELLEIMKAYKTLQNFLEKIISSNELNIEDFYDGMTAKKRESEPRESLEFVKDKLFMADLSETMEDFRNTDFE